VAGTGPDLVQAMCEANRWALLDAVDDALGRLGAARGSLASTGGLAATVRAGHHARTAFEAARERAFDTARERAFDTARERHRGTTQVDLDAGGAMDRLREIGRSGGQVVAMNSTRCQVAL
jgi:prephenate dehydrogenase